MTPSLNSTLSQLHYTIFPTLFLFLGSLFLNLLPELIFLELLLPLIPSYSLNTGVPRDSVLAPFSHLILALFLPKWSHLNPCFSVIPAFTIAVSISILTPVLYKYRITHCTLLGVPGDLKIYLKRIIILSSPISYFVFPILSRDILGASFCPCVPNLPLSLIDCTT